MEEQQLDFQFSEGFVNDLCKLAKIAAAAGCYEPDMTVKVDTKVGTIKAHLRFEITAK